MTQVLWSHSLLYNNERHGCAHLFWWETCATMIHQQNLIEPSNWLILYILKANNCAWLDHTAVSLVQFLIALCIDKQKKKVKNFIVDKCKCDHHLSVYQTTQRLSTYKIMNFIFAFMWKVQGVFHYSIRHWWNQVWHHIIIPFNRCSRFFLRCN